MVIRTAVQAIVTLALGVFAAPPATDAQQPAKIARIGYLSLGTPGQSATRVAAFRQGLRDLGYVEGRDIAIEDMWAGEGQDRLPDLAAELVRLKVDVIVAINTPAARAAKDATRAVPIVFAVVGDPVGTGLVASLAKPGGNLTGMTNISAELSAKRLELLREAIPRATEVGVLWRPAYPIAAVALKETEAAAQALKVRLHPVGVQGPGDFERALSSMKKGRVGAILLLPDPLFFLHREALVTRLVRNRLPAMFNTREFAQAGGLITYGADSLATVPRAATYVDKILKGAKPADLPVEQPTRFELVINMKTARALGLTFPPSILVRADHMIQ